MLLTAILGLTTIWPAPGVTAAQIAAYLQEAPSAQESKPGDKQTPQGENASPPPEQEAADAEAPPQSDTTNRSSAPNPPPAADKTPTPAKKPAHPAKKKKKQVKTAPATGSSSNQGKVVVRNGSTSDPGIQLAPTITKQQESEQLTTTNQLLDATEANLKRIAGKQLAPEQQDTVKQVRSYVTQAKVAVKQGDVQVAQNLANKAHLLSEELIKD